MRLATIVATVAVLLHSGPVSAAVPTMPFGEVEAGMLGEGRTVFDGETIETFQVEIVGTLPRIGPDRDLILARLSGGPLARTGVLAGMSGSPVTIDGKLIGAVAYGWGFSTEPIAGITPIDEMLRLFDGDDGVRRARAAPLDAMLDATRAPDAAAIGDWLEQARRVLAPSGFSGPLPLAVSGVDPAGLRRIGEALDPLGLVPLQLGASGASDQPPARFEPGSPVGLKLTRGDVEMTATGTVTWVDGDRVLGFGHPLFGLGPLELPLTGARVVALLPNLQQSSRLAVPLGEVGALRQDRAAGVMGRLGAAPSMIPVRLLLRGDGLAERRYSFDVADDPLLSPLLLYAALGGVLSGAERTSGSATLRLRPGSVIKLDGQEEIALDNVFAGTDAFVRGTGLPAWVLHLVLNNTWDQPRVLGVNLLLDHAESPRTARVRRVVPDRYRVIAGEEVELAVVLDPYRGPDRTLRQRVRIPAETPSGPLNVRIGGARTATLDESVDRPVVPRDLEQLIRLVNRMRRNDRVYIVATRPDVGGLLGGARLPNLPPSAAALLDGAGGDGQFTPIRTRHLFEETIVTELVVEGSATVRLMVEAP